MTLQVAEKLVPRAVLEGHEFTRADKSMGLTPALAAEGCISQFFSKLLTFSAACLVAPKTAIKTLGFGPCARLTTDH
jgi:hypothetical protein